MEILALAAVAGGVAFAGWLRDRRRHHAKNQDGCCAQCGTPWQDPATGDPFLLHGRLVCAPCAGREQERMMRHFGVLAGATAFASTSILVAQGPVALMLLPLATGAGLTLGAVSVMKLANRRAQRRIATGESPEFETLLLRDR